MPLIREILVKKLSMESEGALLGSVDEEIADPAAEPATPEASVVAATEDPAEVVTPVETTDELDLNTVGDELEAVRAEVEQVQTDTDDTLAATETVTQLEDAVATMEALVERGSITEPELRLTLNRGLRRVDRLGVDNFFLSTESYKSEEGRLETLRLAAESFSETASRVRDAIRFGWSKLKTKLTDILKRLVSSNERIKQAAVALEGKVNALPDTSNTESVAVDAKDHAYLADEHGKTLNAVALVDDILKASKAVLIDYPKLVAAVAADKPVQKIDASILKGLSAAPTVAYDNQGLPVFTTKPESAEASRKAVKMLPKADLNKVLKGVLDSTELLRGDWMTAAFNKAEAAGSDEFDRMDILLSNLLDFYFYVQRVNRALLSLVQAQVTHYGAQA